MLDRRGGKVLRTGARFGLVACAGLVVGSLSAMPAKGGESRPAVTLERQVLPLLKVRCTKCHGPARREGKLSLATPNGLARGGKHGELVAPGRPDDSLMWARVADDEMPPDDPLSDSEKDTIRQWIEAGAVGLPRLTGDEPEAADHWAFAPLRSHQRPAVARSDRIGGWIDQYLQAALESEGLSLGPEAERPALLRRVAYDLTGLPPTPSEVTEFLADTAPGAYARMVERYLASPRYGERWGKYWLDAAGYADSNGYFSADSDRPLAWRYRDYVVRSWNADKPFDQFLREQLAGDELATHRPGEPASPETIDRLVATHFLRNSPDGTGESDGNPDEVRADRFAVLEGTIEILGSTLFGLTFQCARCHDHKFEPVTQQEYYQLQAILAPAYPIDRWAKPNERFVEAPSPSELEVWRERGQRIDAEVAALRTLFVEANEGAEHAVNSRAGTASLRARLKEFQKARARIESQRGPRPGRIAWVSDRSPAPPEVHLLKRGNYGDPGRVVAPGVPGALLDDSNPFDVSPPARGVATTGRRLALARWFTRPGSRASALLARVTVNRVWQSHFGTGLVATPENFGYSGAPPSHPALLDELARAFVASGWSVKSLHRLILNSSAYRQSSELTDKARAVDPDNRLVSRYPLRRLDAEAVRDAMLAASGELDFRTGGPFVPARRSSAGDVVVSESTDGAHRRSVYLQQKRTNVLGMLEVFDSPSIVTNCTRRSSTTIPLQSLSLLNSEFVLARAVGLATRLAREAGGEDDARIEQLFVIAYGRRPLADEAAAARKFIQAQPDRYPGRDDARPLAWRDLCQMVLASNAFLYLD